MKKSRILISSFLLICFISINLYAQVVAGKDLSKSIPVDKAVTIGKLDNGMVYYIKENKRPENRAELQILFKAGSIDEDEGQEGIAHYLEHMLFNGTKNFPKNELISFLESTGMRFGADVNASTGFDRTYYLLTVPVDNAEMFENAFLVLEDWAMNASLEPEEIEKERGVIMEEWLVYRGANERIQRKHYPVIFHNSKFADRLPIGDTAVIKSAKRPVFDKFYRDWYRPNLTAVIAVGDFDKNDVEARIKKHFSKWQNPKNERPKGNYTIPYHKERLTSIAQDKELQFANVSIIYKHERENDNDTYGAYKRYITESLFSMMLNERLQELTKKPNSPFLFAQSGVSSFLANLKAFNLIAIPGQQGIMPAFDAIVSETYRVKQHGFAQSELDRAKTNLLRSLNQIYNERDKTESNLFAREFYEHFMLGNSIPGIAYEKELHDLFVPLITLNEINNVAQRYIRDENLVITLSAQEREGQDLPSDNELLAKYDALANTKHTPYEDLAADKPLMEKLPKSGSIKSEKENKALGTVELELSNGSKVILKHTDFKNDEVMLRAYSLGGSSVAPDNIWLSASNSSGIIDESGVSEFSSTVLQKMLAGKIINLTPFIGELTEGFSGSSSPEDLETFFQLLHLYFTQPRKDMDGFMSYQQRTSEIIKNQRRSPDAALRDTLNAVLGNYHLRSLPLTDEDLDKIDLEAAYKFYVDRFSDASDFVFIFVGNFDLNAMKEFSKTYLASLPTKNRNDKWKDIGKRIPQGKVEKVVKKGIEPKSSVRIVLHNDFEYNSENKLLLQAMTEIFSIRLREVIREDLGGVYGIAAFPRANKYPYPHYLVYIYFGTSPGRVDELIENVNLVIDEIKGGKIGDDYLSRVKEIMKRERETNLKENRWWLNQLYTAHFEGVDLSKDVNSFNKDVDALTPEKIQKAAAKYLKRDNYLQVVLYPED